MPFFKSVAFPARPPISVKFDDELEKPLEGIGSADIREALGAGTWEEALAEANRRGVTLHALLHRTFISIAERRQRRELEEYAGWPAGEETIAAGAVELIRRSRAKVFLDPFAGRANYAALAAQHGLRAYWCEISPVFQRVAEARLAALHLREEGRRAVAERLRAFAAKEIAVPAGAPRDRLLDAAREVSIDEVSAPRRRDVEEALAYLSRLRVAIDAIGDDAAEGLAAAAVVEALPRTTGELEVLDLRRRLRRELEQAAEFVTREAPLRTRPQFLTADARDLAAIRELGAGLIITNPPSLNFANYTVPAAAWFLGVRRGRARRTLDTADALRQLRTLTTPRTARPIAADVARVRRKDPRAARHVANYFLTMAEAFAAIAPHLARRATLALELAPGSTVVDVDVPTRSHVERILRDRRFKRIEADDQLLVMRSV